jgi:hypothetical protein
VIKNRIGLTVVAVALAFSASTCFACGEDAQAADVKDAKAVAASGTATGCDMPCCAHANAGAKTAANAAPNVAADAAATANNIATATSEKPCHAAAAKGCPKKTGTAATAVAKAEPAQDTAKAAPAVDPGTQR